MPPSMLRLALAVIAVPLCCAPLRAQVFVISTETIEGRFLKFEPTHVDLPKMHAGPVTAENLERTLQSESGYAMRPLPLASKGLTLVANGPLTPAGSDYVTELNEKGVSARPGERVMITKIVFNKDKLVLETNGGPDVPHKFLRHLSVGTGSVQAPLAQDHGEQALGSRLTLIFPGGVPNVTGDQVKELIAPVIGFSERSPLEAYVETLPPFLKQAILDKHVLVGMDHDMVLHALGAPKQKVRESDEDRPFEEWVYGVPPEKSEFVRFQQDRVTRVEIAQVGESPIVRTQNEVGNYWQTQGRSVDERVINLGDQTEADRAAQNKAPAPPTLRKPGETLPSDADPNIPHSGKVELPPDKPKQPQP